MQAAHWLAATALLSALWCAPAAAVDFGERTPEVDELADALAPPAARRLKRGVAVVAGASSVGAARASMQIGFEFGSSRIMERDQPKLLRLAEALGRPALAGSRYLVVGHTDAAGSLAVNDRLSLARAQAVLEALVQQGIDAQRLSADGRGPRELLNPERPQGAENRRVEVRLAAP